MKLGGWRPWHGKPRARDVLCLLAIAVSAVYALATIPLTPALISSHPVLLEVLTGGTSSIISAGAYADVDNKLQLALVVVAALSFVVVLARSSSAPDAPAVDTCVVWSGTYRPAPCDEPHTGRVVEEVRDASECPSGYSFTPVSTRVFCIDTSE